MQDVSLLPWVVYYDLIITVMSYARKERRIPVTYGVARRRDSYPTFVSTRRQGNGYGQEANKEQTTDAKRRKEVLAKSKGAALA